MTSCIKRRRSAFQRLAAFVVLAFAVVALGAGSFGVASADAAPLQRVLAQSAEIAGQTGQPSSNLSYVLAVFLITWAAFFGYVFVMSRRQREMRREIEALKRALADREQSMAERE